MKRTLLFVIVLVILIVFCYCWNKETFALEEISMQSNYNYACQSYGFFVDKNMLFFSSDGFYNMRLFGVDSNDAFKFCDDKSIEKGALTGELYVQEGVVWFTSYTDDGFVFYEYDIVKKSSREIYSGKGRIDSWLVKGDILYFTNYTSPNSSLAFFKYNLIESTIDEICEHILWFGITKNEVYYVTEDKTHTLWRYCNGEQSDKVCSKLTIEQTSKLSVLGITENFFVYQLSDSPSNALTVFDLNSQAVTTFTLPKTIQKYIAFENYAFLTLYEEQQYLSEPVKSEENGLYRLCLQTGKLELWQKNMVEAQSLFVINDDCILVSLLENKSFVAKTNVYQIESPDNEPILLYSY